MLRKIHAIILYFILIASFNKASALSDSEMIFYTDHQNAFVQKTFIDDP